MNIRYIITSFVRMIFLLISITMISFFLITSSPMNPVDSYLGEISISEEQRAKIEEEWGLNKSPVERYITWGTHFISGDMGDSISYHEPVSKVLKERFQTSLILMGTAWILSGILGFTLGVISGTYRGSILDNIIKTVSLLFASTPVFWIGLVMLVIFAVELQWFPLGLAAPAGKLSSQVTVMERLHHLILPALTLSISEISYICLHTRQKLIDIMESDYVLFAKARGESTKQIIMRHGLRNICLPAVTLQFAYISELFGGSVLAEQVFSYPGLGNAATHAGLHGDAPMLLGVAVFSALFVFAGNMMANIAYGIIDPRIREGGNLDA